MTRQEALYRRTIPLNFGDRYHEIEFSQIFPDDQTAEAWCSQRRWDGKIYCPDCGSRDIEEASNTKFPYKCSETQCGREFSVQTGTIFEDLGLRCRDLVLVMGLMLGRPYGISPLQLSRKMDIGPKLAWHLTQRIRHRYEARPISSYEWMEVEPEYLTASSSSGKKKCVLRRLGKAVVVDGTLQNFRNHWKGGIL